MSNNNNYNRTKHTRRSRKSANAARNNDDDDNDNSSLDHDHFPDGNVYTGTRTLPHSINTTSGSSQHQHKKKTLSLGRVSKRAVMSSKRKVSQAVFLYWSVPPHAFAMGDRFGQLMSNNCPLKQPIAMHSCRFGTRMMHRLMLPRLPSIIGRMPTLP